VTVNRAEHIAKEFHRRYELLAPLWGYETRKDSAVPWEDVPENNRGLMIATITHLINTGVIQ
jgi:hypothetical protein